MINSYNAGGHMVEHAYIREEIAKAVRNRPKLRAQSFPDDISLPAAISLPVKERPKFLTNFLITCTILVAIATIFGMISKSGMFDSVVIADVAVEKEPQAVQEKHITQKEIEVVVSSIDSRISALESSFKLWSNRVWLLGLVHNETATMLSTLAKKNSEPSDYISFERDWKISRMPRSLKMEDNERIQQNVK
jgi:hypothetical protein